MLSIVIPAYNAESYLEECLESVMACVGHCRTQCEVIVVDDGSTDSTPEIVSRFDRIRLIRQPNRGLSAARNKGIDMAVGEWLMFVDADDCLLSGAPDALVEAAEATKCRIAAGRCLSGQTHVVTKIEILHDVSVLSAPSAIEQTLYQQTPLLGSAWGKIWHKSIFGNLRFSEGLYYEDLDFFYKAFLKSGAVALIETPVYFYRIHGSSFLRTFSPKLLDVLKVTAAMESYMRMHYPSLLKAARDRRLSANFNIYNRIVASGKTDSDMQHAADECWAIIRRLRWSSLADPRVRLKNKIGVLASLCGRHIYTFISKKITNK